MDLHDIWQENKRWILGVVAGLLVFWTVSTIVKGIYSTAGVRQQIRNQQRSVQSEPLYTAEALAAARNEQEELETARGRLDGAIEFVPPDEFLLAGKGDPHLHFDVVSRRVRRELVSRADALGVEHAEGDVNWKPPVGEGIQPTLIGLALLEAVGTRLLDAHERVRADDYDSLGLVSVEAFDVVPHNQGPRRGPRGRGRARASGSDRLVREFRVKFKFRADEATTLLFLEACRSQEPHIALGADFSMTPGPAPGGPLTVSGTLIALRLATPRATP